jgi:two-component sensor histidine kinase
VAFDVRLLVTELVVNSVRHAGLSDHDTISVTLELSPDHLRVDVRDEGPGFRIPDRPQKVRLEGGRGLQIVGAIARRWGVEEGPRSGVWFEIDLDPSREHAVDERVPRSNVRGLVP